MESLQLVIDLIPELPEAILITTRQQVIERS